MVLSLLFSILFSLNTNSAAENTADDALQEVLNIQQVQAYFSQSPRFSSSQKRDIVLLNATDTKLQGKPKINTRDISIYSSEKLSEEGLTVFIKLTDLTIDKNQASIHLTIQNARLLFEEHKQMEVIAQLKSDQGKWMVKDYKIESLNISG